jgi:hypothetical protein
VKIQGGIMTSKLVDNKRRTHADKILQKLSKQASEPAAKHETSSTESSSSTPSVTSLSTLKEQYEVIREDVLKLREDLTKGYDLAKGMVEKKGFINQLLKSR